jgi:hypothetical protein
MRQPWVASQYAGLNEVPSAMRTTSGFALLGTWDVMQGTVLSGVREAEDAMSPCNARER